MERESTERLLNSLDRDTERTRLIDRTTDRESCETGDSSRIQDLSIDRHHLSCALVSIAFQITFSGQRGHWCVSSPYSFTSSSSSSSSSSTSSTSFTTSFVDQEAIIESLHLVGIFALGRNLWIGNRRSAWKKFIGFDCVSLYLLVAAKLPK